MVPPLVTLVLLALVAAVMIVSYEGRHEGRVYTGVRVWGVDLSEKSPAEAERALAGIFPTYDSRTITLVDPGTGERWAQTPATLGVSYDVERTIVAAYEVGRAGNPLSALRDQFVSWYFGRMIAPVVVFDEGKLRQTLLSVAGEIDRPAQDAQLVTDGSTFSYVPGQIGRQLDIADTINRLVLPATDFRTAEVELLVHETRPRVLDDPATAQQIQTILGSPMTLYFQEPLEDLDLDRVEVSTEQLAQWIRAEMVEDENGAHYEVFVDENAVRHWLTEIEARVYKQPQNARFYFDDDTRELVLVEPHVNGRALDVDLTLQRFMDQVYTPDRSLAFAVDEIVPTVNSEATAQGLGITELITQSTTWFYGSSPERKHNIARAASQFFGIVVAPGEEFSFNRYLGDVTEEAGFTTGLIIIGGRTVEGVGGGVCQVSTTLYQAAFWAGFPITERLEHGYRVSYYDDGEGPGMDATVFSPLVDLKFVNNTDHYLLIENYYNETYESLTFKFYSTGTGRHVEKEGPIIENVTEAKPDVWEYNEELEPGEIVQVDWAVEGADVTVLRRVYDANNNLMYGEEAFVSNYIPWQNIYQYGPGVDPESVDPEDMP
jgi:vancomycin resistance protein YoaR